MVFFKTVKCFFFNVIMQSFYYNKKFLQMHQSTVQSNNQSTRNAHSAQNMLLLVYASIKKNKIYFNYRYICLLRIEVLGDKIRCS